MKSSNYNLCLSYDEPKDKGYILYNTKSNKTLKLSEIEYLTYLKDINNATCLQHLSTNRMLQNLISMGFIVDDNIDELKEIRSQHNIVRRSNQNLGLTITPTMSCNLACPYCFELNKYPGLMLPDVQTKLINFVEKNLKTGCKNLGVTWFGGEPLIAISVIEKLSREFIKMCNMYKCRYHAIVITNGTLLTGKAIAILKRSKVTVLQITLDGPQHIHDTKRVGHRGEPSFALILDNLKKAAKHFHISLRINTDKIVAPHLEDLLNRLSIEGLTRKISVYSANAHKTYKLSNEYMNEDRTKLLPSVLPTTEINMKYEKSNVLFNTLAFSAIETNFDNLLEKYGFRRHMKLPSRRYTTCMLDRANSWLIEADGDVQKCWESAGDKGAAVGRLTDNGITLFKNFENWYNWSVFDDPVCITCPFLPICMGNCPIKHMAKDPDHCPTFKFNWKDIIQNASNKMNASNSNSNSDEFKRHVSRHGRINLVNPLVSKITIKELSMAVLKIKHELYKNQKYRRKHFTGFTIKEEVASNIKFKAIYIGKKRLFYLNQLGYEIWIRLDGKHSVENILTHICHHYNIHESERMKIAYDFWFFMKQLVTKNYLDLPNRM